ncbi:ribosomal protection-like ABC-F family protein [Lactococcus fujiensis]|uniref:Multidrug ABC transporter ATP-binding protein n=1 Tax=Lactococcus fujiensis JCM 16395 TaxID=1291764 RepID=A0A2A5RNG9_9LACT|nr:ABC-F type ribosomal protection protein [Lactococcus fujiensis]PCS00883.1 multidrug ABC transporter ATP-binding protein [Lactococcus fujiensis JCM 16395]
MTNIEIKNLTFSYQEKLIFENAQINLDKNWHLGLVGRNGRGKTTLLNLLRGELTSDTMPQINEKFIYFPQEIVDPSRYTNELLTDLISSEQWELERELTLLELDLEVLWRPFSQLSGGEQTKCLLACLFLNSDAFPLIDEPTNHLDRRSRQTVANYLKNKKGYILVSHDRAFLDAVIDHVLAIERRQITLYQGNYSIYEQQKKLKDESELAQNVRLKKDITRLKASARDKSDWSKSREGDIHGNPKLKNSGGIGHDGTITARAARLMKKSKSIERRMNQEVEAKEELLKNIEHLKPLSINFVPDYHRQILAVENFSLAFDDHVLFKPLNFILEEGERLVLDAKNGAGKSSLMKAIEGVFEGQQSGQMTMASQTSISYVRQMFKHTGSLENFAKANALNFEEFLSNLIKLGMERNVFSQRIEDMSQGQQKKVELAKSLTQKAQLYLWDEPLNYLDVFNHEQIIELIQNVKPTMLIIEHDQSFIDQIEARLIGLDQV